MLKNVVVVAAATAIFLFCNPAYSESKYPKGIKCLFSMEEYPKGKSNQASCAMMSEIVYSTRHYKKPRNEHCDIKTVYSIQKFEKFYIDFQNNRISYDDVYYLSEHGQKQQKAFYIKKGDTEEVAEKRVKFRRKKNVKFGIDEIFFTNNTIYMDPKTGEYLKDNHLNEIIYNVVFGGRIFQLGENSPEAIISQFSSNGRNSWLGIRFGKCKIIKK
jgi:hypothetical protein